jgi:predicted Fe-S protein YdhL (DUF1289 family)
MKSKKIITPCIRQCVQKDNKCVGCGRTILEVMKWSAMSDEERLEIMMRLDCVSDTDNTCTER